MRRRGRRPCKVAPDVDIVRTLRRLTTCSGVVLLTAALAACSSRPSDSPKSAALWGDVKPVVSVKELMKYMIDPVADNIFNAVGTTVTKDGVVDTEPKTDEDWEKIQIGAISLAEGAYLLKVPRAFAPPGDLNNSTGP